MNSLKTPLIALLAILSITVGCRRNQDDDVELDTSFTNNEIVAEISFEDIDEVSDRVEFNQQVKSNLSDETLLGCATVTRDTLATDTIMITVDFGQVNCVGSDGKARRGVLTMKRFGSYFTQKDYFREVTTSNYYVNDNLVEVTRKIELSDTTAERHRIYNIDMVGSVILANDAGTITRTTSRQRTWHEGMNTRWNRTDDAYWIEGSIQGTHTNGRSYTSVVAETLSKRNSCDWFDQGVINFTPEGKVTRVLDFGDGTCDNKATVAVGQLSAEIELQ